MRGTCTKATKAEPLDWFCSFSSAAAMVGSPGQGAYAAANSWLDAFSRWRRAQGLPATAIAWGAWAEMGRGAGAWHPTLRWRFRPTTAPTRSRRCCAMIARIRDMRRSLGRPGWLRSRKPASSPRHSSRLARGTRAQANSSPNCDELPQGEWPAQLRRLITDQICQILRRSVDPDRPLSEYGLDSLGILEVRTRIETETGVRISSMDITTVRALAESLCNTLVAKEAMSAPL